jgi:hypothetical protein
MAKALAFAVYCFGAYRIWKFFFDEDPTEWNKVGDDHEVKIEIRKTGEDDSKIGVRIFWFIMAIMAYTFVFWGFVLPIVFGLHDTDF